MGLRVLVVEDNPDTRRFVTQVLRSGGYQVDDAEDGAAALVAVASYRYDLIVTDIEMPRMDGVVAARAVRQLEREHHREPTPIIALTAQDNPATRARSIEAGMNAFLAKPIRSKELLEAVHGWVDDRFTVLVVDDDEPSRKLVASWLDDIPDTRAVEAARAGAALASVRTQRVDLVLLDMTMPGIDGYAAARLFRALPDGKTLPIVAVTAHAGEKERQRCLNAGCTDYAAKPLTKATLHTLIEANREKALAAAADVARAAAPKRAASAPTPVHAAAPPAHDDDALDDAAEALLPAFLDNRAKDLALLQAALENRGFGEITRIGHNLRGSGGSYGFPKLTEIGGQLEDAGKVSDAQTIARAILRLRNELDGIVAARAAKNAHA